MQKLRAWSSCASHNLNNAAQAVKTQFLPISVFCPFDGTQTAIAKSMGACAMLQRHILVVDDEAIVAETVSLLLEWDGHVVDTAGSGEEALSLFQPGKFDLVITDFFMPSMDGGELAAAIKSQAPTQPVVLLTAFAERFRSQNHGLRAIDLVIDKPLPMDSLRQALLTLAPAPKLDCSPSNK